MMEAIQKMIDQKVEEKWEKFQKEYDELLQKVKKNIAGMIKPGVASGLGLGTRTAQSEAKVKSR